MAGMLICKTIFAVYIAACSQVEFIEIDLREEFNAMRIETAFAAPETGQLPPVPIVRLVENYDISDKPLRLERSNRNRSYFVRYGRDRPENYSRIKWRKWFSWLKGSKKNRSVFKMPKGVNMKKQGYKEVVRSAKRHGVNVNFALRVAKQESGGNCKARSHANAKGVMQVIPATARKHGVRRSNNLYKCRVGAETGMKELKYCLRLAGGDKPKALTCYNAGPGWLTGRKYRGRTLPRETRGYIRAITGRKVRRIT